MENGRLVHHHTLLVDDSGRLVYDLWCELRIRQYGIVRYKRPAGITVDVGWYIDGGHIRYIDARKRLF